jgi:hypothetical protein
MFSWIGSLRDDQNNSSHLNQFCQQLSDFITVHLDPYESRWVRYIRLYKKTFDNTTTSAGEAQNATLKNKEYNHVINCMLLEKKLLDLLENGILQLTSKLSGILIQHL